MKRAAALPALLMLALCAWIARPAAVTAVVISPAAKSIRSGQSVRFTATAVYDDATTSDVTPYAVFTLDSGAGRMVLPNGTTSAGPGNNVYQSITGRPTVATIHASYGGVDSNEATVTVTL